MPLLWDCIAVMTVVVIFFFIHSSVPSIHISLGWIAVLGAKGKGETEAAASDHPPLLQAPWRSCC